MTCQFKVKFDLVDNIYRAGRTHWKGVACENYLKPVAMAQAVPLVMAATQPASVRVTLQLVACLQSNCRVDIEVEGQQ